MIVHTENTINIVMAFPNRKVRRSGLELLYLEAIGVDAIVFDTTMVFVRWAINLFINIKIEHPPVSSNQVLDQCSLSVQQEIHLFVPIGIELHPSLLHKHAGEPPPSQWVKGKAIAGEISLKIAVHVFLLAGINDPCFHSGRGKFVEAGA